MYKWLCKTALTFELLQTDFPAIKEKTYGPDICNGTTTVSPQALFFDEKVKGMQQVDVQECWYQ